MLESSGLKYNLDEIVATATQYYEQGLNIIPEKLTLDEQKQHWEKRPLIEWRSLQTRRQTKEEFNALPWHEANAFAVILGQQLQNGKYLACIDYDTKGKVTEESKQKGKEILRDFPITQTEKTVSDGLHQIYYSTVKPKIDGTFHDDAAVELLGENKLCLMAPSIGYTRLNDNTPTEVTDLETLYFKILETHGFKVTEEDTQENVSDTTSFSITQLVDMSKLTQIASDEYQGKHPIHDSTTEKNFTVNIRQNTWYCFRHNSGGGALQYFAMKEGIIKCEHAKKGALRGKKFRDTVQLAIAQGYLKKDAFNLEQEESIADRLVKLTLNEAVELFYDQYKTPYIRVFESLRYCGIDGVSANFTPTPPVSNHCDINRSSLTPLVNEKKQEEKREGTEKFTEQPQIPQYRKRLIQIPLRSSYFKDWLSKLLWEQEQKSPSTEAKNSAIGVLAGKCLAEGRQYSLYNRVAPASDGIWIDMTDDLWRAIHVTSEGWEIVENPPILFRRFNSHHALSTPIKPEDGKEVEIAKKLLDYINIPKDDEATKLSYLCTSISYLIPLIPHPILVVHGPQGSGKSWLFKWTKRLLDPALPELLKTPKDNTELVQQLNHHWIAFYDNLTSMPTWASDTFCTAVTGGGFSKRQLYTDDDDVIYDFKRCVGLNGINPAARRGDLLDRSILVGVARIDEKTRKSEAELEASFNQEKGEILGAFLTILSKSLKLYATVKPNGLFRLADFTRYGCAISEAMGNTSDDFIKAYEKKVNSQTEETINAEPVALAMLTFCQDTFATDKDGKHKHEKWEGTPAQLYQIVTQIAEDSGTKIDNHNWPRAPNAFTRKLNEIASSMSAVGYEIEIRPGTPRKVIITLGKQTKLFTETEATEDKTPEDGKPIFQYRMVPAAEKCDCGEHAVNYEILTPTDDKLRRCEECFGKLAKAFSNCKWQSVAPKPTLSFQET